jgi:hypothetical protein
MLQRVFNSIDRIVFGNKEQYSFEHRFLNVSSFLAALMALIGSASNFLAGLSKSLTIFTFGSSLVFITTYLLFISKRWYLFSKSLFFSAIFLLLDILWYENGGKNPITYDRKQWYSGNIMLNIMLNIKICYHM